MVRLVNPPDLPVLHLGRFHIPLLTLRSFRHLELYNNQIKIMEGGNVTINSLHSSYKYVKIYVTY